MIKMSHQVLLICDACGRKSGITIETPPGEGSAVAALHAINRASQIGWLNGAGSAMWCPDHAETREAVESALSKQP